MYAAFFYGLPSVEIINAGNKIFYFNKVILFEVIIRPLRKKSVV